MKSKSGKKRKPKLEHLSPTSVIKVFLFLRKLIERENLDWDFFESRTRFFNSEELYFVDFYAKAYLNDLDPNNYLNKWTISQQKYLDNPELYERFSGFLEILDINSAKITKDIDKTIKQRESDYRAVTTNIIPNESVNITIPINYKIQLLIPPDSKTIKIIDKEEIIFTNPTKVKEFKKFVCKSLESLLSEDEAKLFFNNSFSFFPNYNISPIFLDLYVTDRKKLENIIFKISEEYKILISHMRNQDTKLYNSIGEKRWKYSQKLKSRPASKIDFMKIMFNAFPHVRNGYFERQKTNPSITPEKYLRSKASNLRDK